MPTYDYQCADCGHAEEIFESFSATPKKPCPRCGKIEFRRLIGAGAGFIFKGSGFYITDYRSDSYRAAEKKESGKPAGSCSGNPSSCSAPACPTPKE